MLSPHQISRGLLPFIRKASKATVPIIGIDLGTTNSCLSIVEGTTHKVIPNAEGNRTTPSVVAFTKDGKMLVGESAKRQAVVNSRSTFFATKRLIGRSFDEEMTQKCKTMVPYKIVKADNAEAWVADEKNNIYSPSQIGAFILKKMKDTAESYLGNEVKDAVVTVPAYFNDSQRSATKNAGTIAGLNVVRILNEPTAAALAYGIERKEGQTVAVYDFGAGTFDISVLQISKEGNFEVKATNGDTFLGGEDFDNVLLQYVLQEFKKANNGHDLSKDPMALQRIKEAVEKAKCELSTLKTTELNLPFIAVTSAGPQHLSMPITRSLFEQLTLYLIEKTINPITNCLKDSKLSPKQIDQVILVGGMTRMPKIVESVANFFGKDPFKGINPDEAVAIGAAIQGSVIRGIIKNVTLLDVTPLSLGIETVGGVFARLIPRNTRVPTKSTQVFSTAADGQTHVDIKVFQGERELVSGNKLLGEFTLSGIPPAPKGFPKIEVAFEINANAIVNVSAKDKQSGKAQAITIQNAGGLTEDQLKKMIEDAQKYSEEDKKTRKLIERKIEIEQLLALKENSLNEHEKVLPLALVSKLRSMIAETKDALQKNDSNMIEEKFRALDKASLDLYGAINSAAANDKK